MSEFTLILTLRHSRSFEEPLSMAVDLDNEVRISTRAVDEMKAGFGDLDTTIRLMKTREFRKELFIQTARRLGALLAERMEDAEGWHDASRIEPARKQLGFSAMDKLERLRAAVERLYYAAYWKADRDVDESELWGALRDAAGLETGKTYERLGAPRF